MSGTAKLETIIHDDKLPGRRRPSESNAAPDLAVVLAIARRSGRIVAVAWRLRCARRCHLV